MHSLRLGCFGNEANEGGIEVTWNFPGVEDVFNEGCDRVSNSIPKFLEENGMETIRAMAFRGLKEKIASLISKSVTFWARRL